MRPDPVLPFLNNTAAIALALLVVAVLARRSLGEMAVPAALGVVAFLGLQLVFGAYEDVRALRTAHSSVHEEDQRLRCLADLGKPGAIDFARWAAGRLEPDTTYTAAMTPNDTTCLGLAMLPRTAVRAGDADVLLFVGEVPGEWRQRFDARRGVEVFAPDFGFARLR